MEILPGIHQVPGLRWRNAYLLVEEECLTLIDAGLPGDGKKIFGYIDHIGRRPSELARVIVTHSHPDHTGPLKRLSQVTGATIMAHRADTRYREKTKTRFTGGLAIRPPRLSHQRQRPNGEHLFPIC